MFGLRSSRKWELQECSGASCFAPSLRVTPTWRAESALSAVPAVAWGVFIRVLVADFVSTGHLGYNQSPARYDRSLVPRSSPVCGGGTIAKDEYNTGLHVMALFVVLAQSTMGKFCTVE